MVAHSAKCYAFSLYRIFCLKMLPDPINSVKTWDFSFRKNQMSCTFEEIHISEMGKSKLKQLKLTSESHIEL